MQLQSSVAPVVSQLHEQYRPGTWAEVVGQDKVLARIQTLRARGLSGRAYFISGGSGTGKTTIARLLAAEVADDWCVQELDAGGVTVSELERLERELRTFGMSEDGRRGRAVIVNECHALRGPAIRQLLVMLERIPSHVVWIFTTTTDGAESLFADCDDASPLLSRCVRLELSRRDLAKPFAERALSIAETEGLCSAVERAVLLAKLVRLCQAHRNNMRAVLQDVEAGALLD